MTRRTGSGGAIAGATPRVYDMASCTILAHAASAVSSASLRSAVSLGEVGVEGSCDMNGSRCRVDSLARFRGQLYELSAAGDKQCLMVRHSPSAGRGQRGGGNRAQG